MSALEVGDKITVKQFKAEVVPGTDAPLGLAHLQGDGFTIVRDERGIFHALWTDDHTQALLELPEKLIDMAVYRDADGEFFQYNETWNGKKFWITFGLSAELELDYPSRPLTLVNPEDV